MIQITGPGTFWLTALLFFSAIFGRYVLFSLAFWWLFKVSMKDQFAHRAVQLRPRKPGQDWREIGWSVITTLIFTAIALAVIMAYQAGYTRIYTDFKYLSCCCGTRPVLYWFCLFMKPTTTGFTAGCIGPMCTNGCIKRIMTA